MKNGSLHWVYLPSITLKFGRNLSFDDVKIDLKDRLFKEY